MLSTLLTLILPFPPLNLVYYQSYKNAPIDHLQCKKPPLHFQPPLQEEHKRKETIGWWRRDPLSPVREGGGILTEAQLLWSDICPIYQDTNSYASKECQIYQDANGITTTQFWLQIKKRMSIISGRK